MMQAFYTGIAGINSSQGGMDVVSDNLANVSNIGFRKSDIEFASYYGKSLDRAGIDSTVNTAGYGSRVQATPTDLSQGTLIQGARDTELAIYGDGWFGVQDGAGNTLYTRNGDFNFDASRDLVTYDGQRVLGTLGNNMKDGVLIKELNSVDLADVSAQKPLNFPESLHYPAEATSEVKFYGNLNTTQDNLTISANAISPKEDRNGITLTFTKSNPQPATGSAWDIVAKATSNDGSVVYDTVQGSATFADNGEMIAFSIPTIDNDGAKVAINLGEGFSGVFSNTSSTALSSSSNGLAGGDLVGYSVNEDANIIAAFSNGRSSSIGKVAVFHFQNDQGLERISGSRFSESSNSGKPIFFKDANGKNITGANILNYKLENSNVAMEVALTQLIVFQNSFDASSKSISTSDQMIQKALQMDA